ncbi:MAG: DNA repair protein RecN [Candidatus Methylomirabilota bacterium]
MLRELRIRNVAVIEEAVLSLAEGLTVLTGETGAGKSILIDALQFVLGSRSSEELLRSGADEAEVEAAFDLGPASGARTLLLAEEIPAEPGEPLLLRRLLARDGRSRAYVNGRLSTASTLRALAEHLVDIHGQHAGQPLLDPKRHCACLDAYAGLDETVEAYRERFRRWQSLARERELQAAADRDRESRQELLVFQEREIAAAALQPDEEEALAAERGVLANHEKLFAAVDGAYGTLEEAEDAALDRLGAAAGRLREAAEIDARLQELLETLETGLVNLGEAARGLRDYRSRLEFDPTRLDAIEARLHEIERLKRKYGRSARELLAHLARVRSELAALGNSEEHRAALDRSLAELAHELAGRAGQLSAARDEAAAGLEAAILAELRALGMAQARFQVRVAREASPDQPFGAAGADRVEFLIAPNPGEPVKPLHRIASGGELSRVMLAVRTVLAASDATPTVVFDEIDTGIGGAMGEVVGRKLVQTSRRHQVLCVTHLPQIACFADRHLVVEKRMTRDRTETSVAPVTDEARVEELSRMLRGASRSTIVFQHARELLEGASRLKLRMDAKRS